MGGVGALGDLDGFFDGNVIWLNAQVFEYPDWRENCDWLLEHEILHAKIDALRFARPNWLGLRRWAIIDRAMGEAWLLAQDRPDLQELAGLLDRYEIEGFDVGEEALVRVIQMLYAGSSLPMPAAIRRAARLLSKPRGADPRSLLGVLGSLPWAAWTVS